NRTSRCNICIINFLCSITATAGARRTDKPSRLDENERAARSIPAQLLWIAAAIEIERVVDMPLAAHRFVIVVAVCGGEPLEPFRDRLEARIGRASCRERVYVEAVAV